MRRSAPGQGVGWRGLDDLAEVIRLRLELLLENLQLLLLLGGQHLQLVVVLEDGRLGRGDVQVRLRQRPVLRHHLLNEIVGLVIGEVHQLGGLRDGLGLLGAQHRLPELLVRRLWPLPHLGNKYK